MIIIIFLLLFNFVKSIDIINIKGFINNDLYNKIYNQSLTNDKYLYIYIDSFKNYSF